MTGLSPTKKRLRARYMFKFFMLYEDPLEPDEPEDASEGDDNSEHLFNEALGRLGGPTLPLLGVDEGDEEEAPRRRWIA